MVFAQLNSILPHDVNWYSRNWVLGQFIYKTLFRFIDRTDFTIQSRWLLPADIILYNIFWTDLRKTDTVNGPKRNVILNNRPLVK